MVAAILETPISLAREERSADLTLQLICERLSAKLGIKAAYGGFGGMADNVAIQSKVTVGGRESTSENSAVADGRSYGWYTNLEIILRCRLEAILSKFRNEVKLR
jgi:hypothetical protein